MRPSNQGRSIFPVKVTKVKLEDSILKKLKKKLKTELRAVFYRRTVSILGRSASEDKGGRALFRHAMCPTCLTNEAADNGHYIL